MNAQGTIVSALDWAARMERGEVEYNSYIHALAEELLRVREENVRFRELLGIHVDEDAQAWDEVVIALRTARERIGKLEQALRPFVENWDRHVEQHRSLNEEWLRLLEEHRRLEDQVARDMSSALNNARTLLEGGGPGRSGGA